MDGQENVRCLVKQFDRTFAGRIIGENSPAQKHTVKLKFFFLKGNFYLFYLPGHLLVLPFPFWARKAESVSGGDGNAKICFSFDVEKLILHVFAVLSRDEVE